MKKITAMAICIIMCFSMLCIASANETATWEIKDNVLTISGTGVIGDFKSETDAPWYEQRTEIKKIVVEEGITRIGDIAFFGVSNAETITIPESVESIGINALSFTGSSFTNISNVDAPFQFTMKSESEYVKAGEDFYITIDLAGDFKNVSSVQGVLIYDAERMSADKDDWCDKAWLEGVNETNLGYISTPSNETLTDTVKFVYMSDDGKKIDSKSPLYNAGKTTVTAAKLKFKAIEDIKDINTTCFAIKDCKVVVTDEKAEDAECSLVQLTNSTILPITNLTVITDNKVAQEYAANEGIKITDSKGTDLSAGSDSAAADTEEKETTNTSDEIAVIIDGKKVEFDVKPIMLNDRTLVPMRKIFEALGAVVTWDDETQTAFGTNGKVVIAFQIDNNIMTKSAANAQSEVIELDVPAQLINDRTLVPVRAISESFGCDVDWIDEIQTVVIKTVE